MQTAKTKNTRNSLLDCISFKSHINCRRKKKKSAVKALKFLATQCHSCCRWALFIHGHRFQKIMLPVSRRQSCASSYHSDCCTARNATFCYCPMKHVGILNNLQSISPIVLIQHHSAIIHPLHTLPLSNILPFFKMKPK